MPAGSDGNHARLRDELHGIGQRRSALTGQTVRLAYDTKRAVQRAKGKIPMVEVAALVGLDRTSVYQTYVKDG